LPLAEALSLGEGVRFIVQLADGTPAFAGAGRCAQVSDQGAAAEATERYETLLDSLAFDERSQPVYEYLVAVRQSVYAQSEPGAEVAEQVLPDDAGGDAGEELAEAAQAAADADEEADEPTQFLAAAEPEEPAQDVAEVEAASVDAGHEYEAAALDAEPLAEAAGEDDGYAVPTSFVLSDAPPSPVAAVPSEAPAAEFTAAPAAIEPLPTGMLQRPAVAAPWQPAPARLPQASPRSGLFRYPSGELPVPAAPPRPAIDPGLRVSRAPGPAPSPQA
jgi:hypothetical protein